MVNTSADASGRTRWQHAVEASGLGVWDWNTQTGVALFSPRWKTMLGYADDEVGAHVDAWRHLLHPQDRAAWDAQMRMHLDGRTPMYVGEHRLRCKDGSYRWMLSRGRVVGRRVDGGPLRVVGTQADVTVRKLAEAALTEREARFRGVFSATFQLMGMLDPAGLVIDGNDVALDFAGLRLDEVVGKPFWELPYFRADPGTAAQMRDAVERAGRGELVRAEVELAGAGDQHMTVDFSLKPVFGADGSVKMLIPEARDISERKRSELTLRESEERLRLTFSASPIGLALVGLDGRWLAVNESLCQIVGYDEHEMMRLTFQDITHAEDLDTDLKYLQRTVSGEIPGYRMRKRYIRKDGSIVPVQLDVTLVRDADEEPLHFISHIQDVSDRVRFEQALQQQKERFEVALSSITDAVFITSTAGAIDFANPVAERLLGLRVDELLGRPLQSVVDLRDDAHTPVPLLASLPSQPAAFVRGVAQLNRGALPPLTLEYALAPLKDGHGAPIGLVFMLHDVTQASALTRALEHQATHDSLTGLLNRVGFEDMLEKQRLSCVRERRPWCLLYLDLDRFKIVNDTVGHAAGDDLLRALTVRLRAMLRAGDVLARLGGDEFGVILDHCGPVQAEGVAAKLIDVVDRFRFRRDKRQFQLGLSIGIALPPDDVYTVADLMRMADAACYVAKRTGRNRACVYRESGIDGVTPGVEFDAVNALQSAFDEERVRVYAQKIVDLSNGRAVGVELLTRLVTAEGVVVMPEHFLPAAERNDLITRLDAWMLRRAAGLLAGADGTLPDDWFVTVNVSGLSLSDLRFHGVISEVMASGENLRDRIYFEITESAAPSNLPVTYQGIELLRSHGSRVLLDDFGSGFTSFNYLRKLGVDGLKIAQDFTNLIDGDPINEPLIMMVAQLARKLGIQAIAEGVEDAAIAEQLYARGIGLGQGYFFHRPEPVDRLLR